MKRLVWLLLPWRDPDLARGSRRTDRFTIVTAVLVAGVGLREATRGRLWLAALEFAAAGVNLLAVRRRRQNLRFYEALLLCFDAEIAMAGLITCPGCDLVLPADDLWGQQRHMMEEHPEIVQERRQESARWDGWEALD